MAAFDEVETPTDAPEVPKATKLECDRVRFNIDSCIPDPKALPVFRAVYQICAGNPDFVLLISSHTDKQASDDHNQWLSNARSASIQHLLTEDPEVWAKHVVAHRKEQSDSALQKDVDDVLSHFGAYFNWPDAVPPAGKSEKTPCAAQVKRFKELCDARFSEISFPKVDGEADEELWLCVALCYQHALRDQLGLGTMAEMNAQYVQKIKWLDPEHPGIGCGERHPRDDGQQEDVRDNRRTEFLFFPSKGRPKKDPAEKAPPKGQPPAWLESLAVPAITDKFNAIKCPDPPLAKHGNILFVIDCSGSMTTQCQGARTRMELARSQLIGCLRALDERDHFGIVAYSCDLPVTQHDRAKLTTREVRLWEPGMASRKATEPCKQPLVPTADLVPRLYPATLKNVGDAVGYINGVEMAPAGLTMTARALQVAFKATGLRAPDTANGEKEVPMTVVLLTDGEPTGSTPATTPASTNNVDSSKERAYILKNIAAWNGQKWPLTIYGIMDKGATTLHDFLQKLGKASPLPAGAKPNIYIPWGAKMTTVTAK